MCIRDSGKAAYIAKARCHLMRDLGAQAAPMNAFLLNLGMETLALRMERHLSLIHICSGSPWSVKCMRTRSESLAIKQSSASAIKQGKGSFSCSRIRIRMSSGSCGSRCSTRPLRSKPYLSLIHI